ncbi:MAG: CopG family transcriptional regulator [Halolamina sp.]
MPEIEVDLPDRIDSDIDRLVEDGKFVNREQAVEELLTRGVSAYSTETDPEPESEDLFTQTVEDQRDPAMRDDDTL